MYYANIAAHTLVRLNTSARVFQVTVGHVNLFLHVLVSNRGGTGYNNKYTC